MKKFVAVALSAAMLGACATTYTATPRPSAGQTVRYVQGMASTFDDGENVSVQVTPLGLNEKGRLLYSVAVYNRGAEPVNFGVENVAIMAAGAPVRVFTYPELERMAKNDATTALVLTALAGGAAAYSAASSPTYRSTTTTPYGTYTTTATNYAAQAVAASAVSAATTVQLNNIGANLDNTLSTLGNNVLQTTTIDQNTSYGGQVVGDRVAVPDSGTLPTTFIVEISGERFSFDFDIVEQR